MSVPKGPRELWLQIEDETGDFLPAPHRTHAENQIYKSDVRYVRADIAEARVGELETRVKAFEADAELRQRRFVKELGP